MTQVYFAFCVFKAIVETAFAIYTLWLWNILFAIIQAEKPSINWTAIVAARRFWYSLAYQVAEPALKKTRLLIDPA